MLYKIKNVGLLFAFAGAIAFTGCDSGSTGGTGNGGTEYAPKITLDGPTELNITLGTNTIMVDGDKYSAYDPQEGDLSAKVKRTHDIDFTKEGAYRIKYFVEDNDGYSDTEYRTVNIKAADYTPYTYTYTETGDTTNGDSTTTYTTGSVPTITFKDDKNTIFVNQGTAFDKYEGMKAYDFEDGDLTNSVKIQGDFDSNKVDTYYLTYEVTDRDGNYVTANRTIYVLETQEQGYTYAETTDIDLFKTWYSETCGQEFKNYLYDEATGEYAGSIDCSNRNLDSIDLTTLSIFRTIRSLNLSHNNLNYIDFDQLNLTENNVKVLEDLDLSYNNFSDVDFTPLHNLKNIDRLWIQGNNFDYTTQAKREALYRIFNNRSLTIYF